MKPISSFLLCSMFLLLSCKEEKPPAPEPDDPKTAFEKEVKDPKTSGYYFSTFESANEKAMSLSNPDIGDLIEATDKDTSFTVRYTKIADSENGTGELYKTEFVKVDTSWSLRITDQTNKKVFYEKELTLDSSGWKPGPTGYTDLTACINDFKCKHECVLQREANRSCEPQFAGMICCLRDTTCYSVHLVFPPSSWRCIILQHLPLESVVLTHKNL